MSRGPLLGLAAATAATAAALGYRALATGQIHLDLGVGRTLQPLGPVVVDIGAPREVVFDVVAAPYLGRTPRAMAEKLEVLERSEDMVLAAHHTPVGWGMVTTTVETVRFERPDRIHFRLVRGPVPYVVETFMLDERDGGTRLTYDGELGTDLWALGRRWGALVAKRWVTTVEASLAGIKEESERRAA